jgi:hypothetical protein
MKNTTERGREMGNPMFSEGLFGKWRIQVDGRVFKGILRNFDL